MRTLVIAESRVFRAEFSKALEHHDVVELVASEFSSSRGLRRIARGDIELVLLDVSLAGDAREGFLKQLGDRDGPGPIVLALVPEDTPQDTAVSTLRYHGFAGVVSMSVGGMATTLKTLRRSLGLLKVGARPAPVRAARPRPPTNAPAAIEHSALGELVVIVSSTGGPAALQIVLGGLSPSFRTPIVIVQHLPPGFHESLASNLSRQTGRSVRVARDRERISGPGVFLAPGESHLEVQREGEDLVCRLVRGPRENGCLPAGDRTLRTAAAASQGNMVGVCLTGMGRDGADGMTTVARAGGQVIVQDEETCVVWGMPSSVLATGTRAIVLPLQSIPAALNRKELRVA